MPPVPTLSFLRTHLSPCSLRLQYWPSVSALALAEFASHFETPSTPPRSLSRGGLALVAGRVGQLPGQLAHLLQPLSHLLAQPALLAPSQHSIQYRKRPSGPEFLNPAEHPVIH